jgi:hypothetical protein
MSPVDERIERLNGKQPPHPKTVQQEEKRTRSNNNDKSHNSEDLKMSIIKQSDKV